MKNIESISVRDKNSGNVVKELIGKEPMYNFDPVLVYDFIGKSANVIPKNFPEKNHMILYGYSGRFSKEECKKIREYADNKGLLIYCIGGVQDACDRFIDCNPFQVIAYFQNTDCVITDTFHGTILSVITHKQFVTILRNIGYGNSEKLSDLLFRLGLESRCIDNLEFIGIEIDKVINYDKVDEIIKSKRNRSYEYLKVNIET